MFSPYGKSAQNRSTYLAVCSANSHNWLRHSVTSPCSAVNSKWCASKSRLWLYHQLRLSLFPYINLFDLQLFMGWALSANLLRQVRTSHYTSILMGQPDFGRTDNLGLSLLLTVCASSLVHIELVDLLGPDHEGMSASSCRI